MSNDLLGYPYTTVNNSELPSYNVAFGKSAFSIGAVTLWCGDCTTIMHTLPADYTVICDPPYTVRDGSSIIAIHERLNTAQPVLALTNPAHGYIWNGETHSVPALAPYSTPIHPAVRPLEEMMHLVALTSGIIVDPYSGTGTTLVAALMLGRTAIGMEIHRGYYATACARLIKAAQQLAASTVLIK
jgi:hypothetical protein